MSLYKDFEQLLVKYDLSASGLILADDSIFDWFMRSIPGDTLDMRAEYNGEEIDHYSKCFHIEDNEFSFTVKVSIKVKWNIEKATRDWPERYTPGIIESNFELGPISIGDFATHLVLNGDQENRLIDLLKSFINV